MLYIDVVHPKEMVEMCITGVSLETAILLEGCTTSTYNNINTPKLIILSLNFIFFNNI